MVVNVEQLQSQVDFLEAKVKGLTDMLSLLTVNGLNDAFDGSGGQTFGGGLLRLDKTGIQVRTNGALLQALYWLYGFSTNPSSTIPRLQLLGYGGVDAAAGAQGRWQAVSAVATDVATAQITSATDIANVTLSATTTAANVQVQLQTDTAANGYVSVVGPLLVSNVTSDYTALADGELWYRSDTDKFKARINGATENLATESYVLANSGGGTSWTGVKVLSVNSTNGTVVKAAAGTLGPFTLVNTNAAVRYLHLYDSATVNVGVTVPKLTFAIPASTTGKQLNFITSTGVPFSTGICYSLTTGAGDADAGAVAANEITGVLNFT